MRPLLFLSLVLLTACSTQTVEPIAADSAAVSAVLPAAPAQVEREPSGSTTTPPYIHFVNRDIRVFRWMKMKSALALKVTPKGVMNVLKSGVQSVYTDRMALNGKTVLINGKPQSSDYNDFSAMGQGPYIAFSPTESMFFGYVVNPENIDFTTGGQASVLISFVIPKGSAYAVVAQPEFIRRANALYNDGKCVGYSWSGPEPIRPGKIRGMSGVQAIFRSCPEIKKQLLTYRDPVAGVRTVDFAIYTEYAHGDVQLPIFNYNGLTGVQQINNDLATQAVQRWGVLTNIPHDQAKFTKSISVWTPSPTNSKTDLALNKKYVQCAVVQGTTYRRLPQIHSDWWDSKSTDYPLNFLGYNRRNTKGFTAISKKFSDVMSAQAASLYYVPDALPNLWDTIGGYDSVISGEYNYAMSLDDCPSLYALAHSQNEEHRKLAESYVGVRTAPVCPLIPNSIAYGIDRRVPNFVDLAKSFKSFDPAKCQPLYEQFRTTVVPTYMKWKDACASGGPLANVPAVKPMKLPAEINVCDKATTAAMDELFLSKRHLSEDLPGDEIGDSFNYIVH